MNGRMDYGKIEGWNRLWMGDSAEIEGVSTVFVDFRIQRLSF